MFAGQVSGTKSVRWNFQCHQRCPAAVPASICCAGADVCPSCAAMVHMGFGFGGLLAGARPLLHAMSNEFKTSQPILWWISLQAGRNVLQLWQSCPQQVRRRLPLGRCVPVASRTSTKAARHRARRSLAASHFPKCVEHIAAWT